MLQRWYDRVRRELPWRATRDPYRILVSEIMLQQTRVQTVIPYYERFLARFADVHALAKSPEPEVLACWSGLGYYSRARNLQAAAKNIAAARRFPREYKSIRQLPGVGPYTAAAVASIAFDLPHAAVDGNVLRVIARLNNDSSDIAAPRTRTRFQQIAGELLDRRNPGRFNQAMMELGATVCLPRAPQCAACPVVKFCKAFQTGRQNQLPVKRRHPASRLVHLYVAIAEKHGKFLLRRRAAGESLMPGFWELPSCDDVEPMRQTQVLGSFRHTITHQPFQVTVSHGRISRRVPGFSYWSAECLDGIPLTTITRKALHLLTSH